MPLTCPSHNWFSQLDNCFTVHTGGIVLFLNASPLYLYRMQHLCLNTVSRLSCMHARKTQLCFSSEVSGDWTKWIQFQIVKRNGHCALAIDVQEGIHAMSRNSSNNRSSNKQRKNSITFAQQGASAQNSTAQGIDEACKTVLLRVTAAATRVVEI